MNYSTSSFLIFLMEVHTWLYNYLNKCKRLLNWEEHRWSHWSSMTSMRKTCWSSFRKILSVRPACVSLWICSSANTVSSSAAEIASPASQKLPANRYPMANSNALSVTRSMCSTSRTGYSTTCSWTWGSSATVHVSKFIPTTNWLFIKKEDCATQAIFGRMIPWDSNREWVALKSQILAAVAKMILGPESPWWCKATQSQYLTWADTRTTDLQFK